MEEYKGLNFGKYCKIEQKRYGADNEFYTYKVIGAGMANYYIQVPVDTNNEDKKFGESVPVVKAICCGVCEETVQTFRVCDVEPSLF